jgi:diaminopimelate decarboxylase
MTKTSQEMKELVEEFIKVTNINYEDQTDKIKEKSKIIDWQFHVGANVIISKNTNRSDRIHVNVNMRFPSQDAKLLVMKNQSFSKAIMEISEICTVCNVGHQWIKDGENIGGLAIFSHVDEQILDRSSFHNAWDNVARVSGHVQKILRSNFSEFSTQNNTIDTTIDKSMYG